MIKKGLMRTNKSRVRRKQVDTKTKETGEKKDDRAQEGGRKNQSRLLKSKYQSKVVQRYIETGTI